MLRLIVLLAALLLSTGYGGLEAEAPTTPTVHIYSCSCEVTGLVSGTVIKWYWLKQGFVSEPEADAHAFCEWQTNAQCSDCTCWREE